MTEPQTLRRELGLLDAVLLGLGSIIGTGVYVSLGFVMNLAGSMTIPVIITAGFIALCNGLSSAQLAAVHPVAGGTYEYGYKFIGPWAGRLAGWTFLIAKSASAATAALAIAASAGAIGGDQWADASPPSWSFQITDSYDEDALSSQIDEWMRRAGRSKMAALEWRAIGAVGLILLLGTLTHAGVRRATWANTVFVTVGVMPLIAFFIFVGVIPRLSGVDAFYSQPGNGMSTATGIALAFVAFTGYGRVATLGEEVHAPRRTIPCAIVVTLASCVVVYVGVAWACSSVTSADNAVVYSGNRPLLSVVNLWSREGSYLYWIIAIGGIAAMLGVVLNLILGLSRVALAMARRGDLPPSLATIHRNGQSPGWAVLFVTVMIASIAALGGIYTSWTVSALTVLIYYAITNWAALKIPPEDRFIPSWISSAGLASCLFFAPFALYELLRPFWT